MKTNPCLWIGLLLGLLAVPWTATAEVEWARYRTSVTEEQIMSWARFRGLDQDLSRDPAARHQALREFVLTRTLSEEAIRRGLDREPPAQIERIDLTARLIKPLFQQQINASVQVSETEIEERYQAIQGRATRERKVRLYNIFKRFPENATEQQRDALLQEMERIRLEVEDLEDFIALAEIESESQTRFQKGLLGNVRAGTLRPAVDAVAMALKPGELSQVLEEAEGLTLLFCERILEAQTRTPDEMRQVARNQVEKFKWDQAWREHQSNLIDQIEARFRWQVLDQESPSDREVLADLRSGVLTLGEVFLLTRTDLDTLRSLSRDKIQERLEPHLRNRSVLHLAQMAGWLHGDADEHRELRENMHWTLQQVNAGQALTALIQEKFEPLSEKEIRAYFETHREEFERPVHFEMAVIALPIDKEDPRRAYAQGQRLLKQLRDGRIDFASAAREYSVDPSAEKGGEIGWISRWNLPKRLGINALRQTLRMGIGDRSDLVQDEQTLRILELRNLEEARLMTFEEARTGAENALGAERVRQLEAQINQAWLEDLDLEITVPP